MGEVKKTFVKTYQLKKASDADDIYDIEGIATEEGSADKGDEVFEAGCFDEEIGKTIVIQVMHEGIRTIVGSAKLSKIGSMIIMKGRLYDDVERARAIARAKDDGYQFNLSIGGRRLDYSWVEKEDGSGYYLSTKKATIKEVSITGEGEQAHPSAIVTKDEEKNKINKEEKMNEELKKALEAMNAKMDKMTDKASSEEISKVSGQVSEVVEKVKTIADTLEKADEKYLKVEEKEGFAKKKEIEEINKTIAKLDEVINKLSTPGAVGDVKKTMEESMNSFNKYLKAGTKNYAKGSEELQKFNEDYVKTITTDTASAGNLIPQVLENEILKDLRESNPFFRDAKIYEAQGKTIDIPIRDAWTNSVENVAEGNATAANGDISWDLVTLEAGILQSQIPITDEIRDDSVFDVAAEVMEAVEEDFNAKLSEDIVNGTVSATQKFEGFTQNATLIANAIETTESLGAGAKVVIKYDDFVNTEMALKKHDRINASYYASRDMVIAMKTLKTSDGLPLWLRGLTPEAPDTFMGYPVEEVFNMDDLTTAGNYPLLFANFRKMYGIFNRKGITSEIDRDPKTRTDLHVTSGRMGGKTIRPWAGQLLKVKA